MDYYSTLKNMKFASKWMEQEKNHSSKLTQTQKGKHNMFTYKWVLGVK